jgi:hypothetical protein
MRQMTDTFQSGDRCSTSPVPSTFAPCSFVESLEVTVERADEPLSEIIAEELQALGDAPSDAKDGARIHREVDEGATEEALETAWSIEQSHSYDVMLADLEEVAVETESASSYESRRATSRFGAT